MAFWEDMKQTQGPASCGNGWVLPRAILVVLAVVLVAMTITKFHSMNGKINPGDAAQSYAAVLVKKLPRPSDQDQMIADAGADAQAQMAVSEETAENADSALFAGDSDHEIRTHVASPEQPELEKLMDWMVKRRSPKY